MASKISIHPKWYIAIEEGRKLGCAHEMVCLASLASTQNSIFKRPYPQRYIADEMHVKFRDPESDHITYFMNMLISRCEAMPSCWRSVFRDVLMSPVFPLPPTPALLSSLQWWQKTGKERLKRLAESVFRGVLFSDRIGLGESLTAIVAAMELRRKIGRGFIMILCPAACIYQWAKELTRHFKPVS